MTACEGVDNQGIMQTTGKTARKKLVLALSKTAAKVVFFFQLRKKKCKKVREKLKCKVRDCKIGAGELGNNSRQNQDVAETKTKKTP